MLRANFYLSLISYTFQWAEFIAKNCIMKQHNKFLIYLVFFGLVISFIVQFLIVGETNMKKTRKAIENHEFLSYSSNINDTICSLTSQHRIPIFVFCHNAIAYSIGDEPTNTEVNNKISQFYRSTETLVFKNKNDTLVCFVNGKDTLKVIYRLDKKSLTLFNGKIIGGI